MAEETSGKKRLQRHAAFYAGIQIELEEADKLIFENEHQLSTKPMGIDVLIIKKHKEEQIKKNIGRIFRGHNIIEYKSPDDNFWLKNLTNDLEKKEDAQNKLLEQISKKLAKGKSVEQSADELEETVESIRNIMNSMNTRVSE